MFFPYIHKYYDILTGAKIIVLKFIYYIISHCAKTCYQYTSNWKSASLNIFLCNCSFIHGSLEINKHLFLCQSSWCSLIRDSSNSNPAFMFWIWRDRPLTSNHKSQRSLGLGVHVISLVALQKHKANVKSINLWTLIQNDIGNTSNRKFTFIAITITDTGSFILICKSLERGQCNKQRVWGKLGNVHVYNYTIFFPCKMNFIHICKELLPLALEIVHVHGSMNILDVTVWAAAAASIAVFPWLIFYIYQYKTFNTPLSDLYLLMFK